MPQNALEADLFRRALLAACICIAVLDAAAGVLVVLDAGALADSEAFNRTLSWLPAGGWGGVLVVAAAGIVPTRTRVPALMLVGLWFSFWGISLASAATVHYLIATYSLLVFIHVFVAVVQHEARTVHATHHDQHQEPTQHGTPPRRPPRRWRKRGA